MDTIDTINTINDIGGINTVMFDLDGTLLPFYQDDFVKPYFSGLASALSFLNFSEETITKAVWAGTKAMVKNDGTVLNKTRFWEMFSSLLNITRSEKLSEIETITDRFYVTEFDDIRSIITKSDVSAHIVKILKGRGFKVVLATNPLFPLCAVETRLKWIGLCADDFDYITTYENSHFCKPNLGYFEELLKAIDKSPSECLMVGNNRIEDLCIEQLSVKTFLVTDFVENEDNTDFSPTFEGSMGELLKFVG